MASKNQNFKKLLFIIGDIVSYYGLSFIWICARIPNWIEQLKRGQMEKKSTFHPYFLMNVEKAAKLAGYSIRQFRRVMDEDRIPVVIFPGGQGGEKFFIMTRDMEAWMASHKPSVIR